jgi:hypothetical protein
MLEDRPLQENEELIGDRVAALFYSEPTPQILESVYETLKTLPENSKNLTLEATLNRLYQEKRIRQEYLSQALGLESQDPKDRDLNLLKTSESALEGELLEQLRYYKNLSQNLTEFELLSWLKNHRLLIDAIAKLPAEKINQLKDSCDNFTEQYFGQAAYRRPDQVSLPPGLTKLLSEAGLISQINNYETISEKAGFIALISQICAVLTDPDSANLDYEQKLRAVAFTSMLIQA